jgi:hypothetical protein
MDKDQLWRAKIRALTAALGAAGEAVYNEIEAAVEDRIEQARDDGYRDGQWSEIQNNSH